MRLKYCIYTIAKKLSFYLHIHPSVSLNTPFQKSLPIIGFLIFGHIWNFRGKNSSPLTLIYKTWLTVIPRTSAVWAIWEEHKSEQVRVKSWLASLEYFQWESFMSFPSKEL